MTEEKQILLTKDGLKKLTEELEDLKNVKRKEVAEKLKEAISYGDLSENAEYDAAKNEQAFVEGRILEIESMIENAKVIKGSAKSGGKIVQLGSTVEIVDASSKAAESETFTLVGSTEADPFSGKISNESPLGVALLEAKVGDEISYDAPKGKMKYKVKKVS
jgi:transcription elongation factor GreA